jgi:hypothetical protein
MRSEGMIASSVKNTGAVARLAMSGTLERRAQRVRQAAARMTAGGASVGSKLRPPVAVIQASSIPAEVPTPS